MESIARRETRAKTDKDSTYGILISMDDLYEREYQEFRIFGKRKQEINNVVHCRIVYTRLVVIIAGPQINGIKKRDLSFMLLNAIFRFTSRSMIRSLKKSCEQSRRIISPGVESSSECMYKYFY